MKRYEAQRLYSFPIGGDTGYGIWDFHNAAYVRLDGRTWNTWDKAYADRQAARLNAGKGFE